MVAYEYLANLPSQMKVYLSINEIPFAYVKGTKFKGVFQKRFC